MNDFFEKNPPPYFTFDYGKLIPIRKINNSRRLYAHINPDIEIPLILLDDTFFRSGKIGILVTDQNIFYRLKNKRNGVMKTGKFPLSEIKAFSIVPALKGSNLIVNNQVVAYIRVYFQKNEAEILNRIIGILVADVQSK